MEINMVTIALGSDISKQMCGTVDACETWGLPHSQKGDYGDNYWKYFTYLMMFQLQWYLNKVSQTTGDHTVIAELKWKFNLIFSRSQKQQIVILPRLPEQWLVFVPGQMHILQAY